ncbi:hypothetical protein HY632_04140 [Candidatus Uhrbacteria bacterium]|nr:hypothetical protein [Candidatus Uhrbacteria bacterium]
MRAVLQCVFAVLMVIALGRVGWYWYQYHELIEEAKATPASRARWTLVKQANEKADVANQEGIILVLCGSTIAFLILDRRQQVQKTAEE